ncbi:pyridoxal-5'-phosphate-dependent enzyme subunit beta [Nitzschia inconspicua]|uniref:L-serine ammonia-lyase n=1 Tax=Nitzschia inconspicua TaxID=303405 RepID=A0A9K3LJ97_9STRA|nr:pyridoxal-5'-phosphate-dependent enzyme subunit beta [Nitzschia inconspicua]
MGIKSNPLVVLVWFVLLQSLPTAYTFLQKSSTKQDSRMLMTSSSTTTGKAATLAEGALHLFTQTPLVKSAPLSSLVGKEVYLKLDALQASGSFKDRGMAHLCATFHEQGVTKLISSSGGNAGLAVATVGKQLNMNVQVIVPETTKPLVITKLESLGAHVTVHGINWNEADSLARERVGKDPHAQYVSPYDNPLLWTGHSSIVDEVVEALPAVGAMVVSVGGGGLLCGILEGCERQQLATKIIASETEGASSFGQAWEKGEVVTLPGIDSIATSLGATSVTPVALERARKHVGGFASAVCTDAEAIDACVQFAQDHRLLVEPACGAALAVAYSERLRHMYLSDVTAGPIVLEVCGGSGVNIELMHQWKEDYLK